MKSRVGVLSAALCLLAAFCRAAPAQPASQSDSVGSFVDGLRGPVAEREALFAAGEDSLAQGRYREAEDTFQRLMVRYPANARVIGDLARTYIVENRNDEALAFLQGQVARHPDRQDILFSLVQVAVELHAYNPAIAALRRAERVRPDAGVGLALARALSVARQEAEAAAIYREVFDPDVLDGPAQLRRASELSQRDADLDIALTRAELAKELLPESAGLSDTLGWLYLKTQRTPTAVPLLRELVTQNPQVSTYHYHLAMALIQGGDTQGAIAELHSAL
jgi:tetratricopeptide (TPR) repeat protein